MESGVNLLLKDDIASLSSNPFGADLDKLEGACGIAVVEDCSKDVSAAFPTFLLLSLLRFRLSASASSVFIKAALRRRTGRRVGRAQRKNRGGRVSPSVPRRTKKQIRFLSFHIRVM